MPVRLDVSDADLADLATRFEQLPAGEIVRWAAETFGDSLCLLASMTDTVLIDLATRVVPGLEVVFVDTGYHFPETLATVERARQRYKLNLTVARSDRPLDDLWKTDPDACCSQRKVVPMEQALEGRSAWISGLRRADSPTRTDVPVIQRDRRGLVKVNPIATWTDLDVEGYARDHAVVKNPLLERGFPSIGCWPCTRSVRPGEHARSGRWADSDKMECGLHL